MDKPPTLPEPLFFKVIGRDPSIVYFVNAAHVIKIEIDGVKQKSGTLHLDDGTRLEVGANEADWIMSLMALHAHEQNVLLGEFKKLTG